jgi:hypothetical protein
VTTANNKNTDYGKEKGEKKMQAPAKYKTQRPEWEGKRGRGKQARAQR